MKKLISVALALVLLLGIIPLDVFASDYQELSTSQAMIDIIKDYEGFHPYPYADNTQWTVGYGTCCGAEAGSNSPSGQFHESSLPSQLVCPV